VIISTAWSWVLGPPLRCRRTPTGSPIGIPPHGGSTRRVTTTRFSPVAYTIVLRVERTASRKLPAPSTQRPLLCHNESSRSRGTGPSGQNVATTRTAAILHSLVIDQAPARTKRW